MSQLLAQARLRACRRWPFASHAILSLVPVPRPGLGTLAVDQHWRLYFDEAALQQFGEEQAAGVILHELDHLLKRHHKRGKSMVGDDPSRWELWNYATDASINANLRNEGVPLPEDVVYPERFDLPDGLSAEEYFRKLVSLVRRYCDLTVGIGERSYRRPSRRNGNPRMALPGNVAPLPRIIVIVDTSGSMGADDLGLALGMIRKVLNSFRIRDGIKVITGDMKGQTRQLCLSDPRSIDLAGGGGTDMSALVVEAVQERPQPQMVLVCTDGWTPWPNDDCGVPVVACLSNRVADLPDCYQPPTWIKTFELKGTQS